MVIFFRNNKVLSGIIYPPSVWCTRSWGSNSRWHKKCQKVPVGESWQSGKEQLRDRLEKLNPGTDDFFRNFYSPYSEIGLDRREKIRTFPENVPNTEDIKGGSVDLYMFIE